jgi:hypothetical protein
MVDYSSPQPHLVPNKQQILHPGIKFFALTMDFMPCNTCHLCVQVSIQIKPNEDSSEK